jgi:ribosomal protein S18 acetylase RimI-like enzyme
MSAQMRELTADDAPALREFFAEMPGQDRTFFFQDVDDPAVVDAWAGDPHRIRRCAVDAEGQLLAISALRPGNDWSSHVAELMLLVSPRARRQGVGRGVARAMLIEAVNRNFKKVSVMIAADNAGAIEMFHKLGFQPEALLRDQLQNPTDGELRDTVILSHMVEENWATMLTGGFESAVG